MKVLLCLLVFGVINCITSCSVQDELLRNYVKSLSDKLNREADPCTDFTSFACNEIEKPKPNRDEILVYKRFLNGKPTTPLETVMQKFFISCEKLADNWPYDENKDRNVINLSKIVEQIDILKENPKWPAEGDYNSNKLSGLLGEMMSIFQLTNYMYIEANNEKLEIFAPEMGKYTKDQPKYIASTIKTYYPENEEAIDEAIKDIDAFETKLEEILNEYSETVSIPIKEVTGLNLAELVKVVKKNWFITDNMEAIVTDSRIIKIVKLISETDSKIIVNHFIYKLIDYVENTARNGCSNQFYFRAGVMDLFWRHHVSEQDHKTYVEILNSFTKSFKDAEKELGANDPDHEVDQELKLRREFYEQRDEWFKQLYYDKVNIEDNFLQSIFNIARLPLFSHKENFNDIYTIKIMTFGMLLEEFKELQLQNKPILYYFAIANFKLWSRAFDSEKGWIKTDPQQLGLCLATKQNVEIPSNDWRNVLRLFAKDLYNLNDFNSYLNNLDKEQTELENEILKEYNLNHLQAYFISLKRQTCIDRTNYLDVALANRKEFATAFDCKVNKPMNPKDKCNIEF